MEELKFCGISILSNQTIEFPLRGITREMNCNSLQPNTQLEYHVAVNTICKDFSIHFKSEVSSNPLSSAQELHVETKESRENDCQKLEAPISNENKSLTEPEKRLKELLVTSQLFLNTIDTLFKLNIPITILQTNDLISKNSEFKLKVHCSYEIAKRKARRQKLLNHPYAKISIGCIKVRSLDDLIKQLCKGFDVLSCYGSNRHSTAEDYLHTVLEKDIQNRQPDLNSTWDFGWDTMMSTPQEKDEIVRDVEKNLLNGLLDEITLDLLQITASV